METTLAKVRAALHRAAVTGYGHMDRELEREIMSKEGMSDSPKTDEIQNTPCPEGTDFNEWRLYQYKTLASTLERQNAELLAALKGIVAAADANQAAIVLTLIAQARQAIRRAEA